MLLSQHAPSGWDPGPSIWSSTLAWLYSLLLLFTSLLCPFLPPLFPLSCFLVEIGISFISSLSSYLASAYATSSSKSSKHLQSFLQNPVQDSFLNNSWLLHWHMLDDMPTSCCQFYKSHQLTQGSNTFLPNSDLLHGLTCGKVFSALYSLLTLYTLGMGSWPVGWWFLPVSHWSSDQCSPQTSPPRPLERRAGCSHLVRLGSHYPLRTGYAPRTSPCWV